ncbi:TPA: hypothetical protein ACVGL4_000580 [Pseudomonas aeruginosa]
MSIELNKESVEQADASSCQGTNCGTTTGDHSSECLAEAAAGQGWELKPGDLCGRDCPIHKILAEQAGGDERKLSDLGNELHNLSCSIVHENEKLAEQIGGIARELWNWPQSRAALEQPSPDAPYADDIAADLERSDWTPEDALRWYAAGKHFDTTNGRTRIIDTGAVASNALKHLSLPYLEMKGDAELTELREAMAQPSPKCNCPGFGKESLSSHAPNCPVRASTAQPSPAQAEAERPEVVARVVHSNPVVLGQCGPLNANDELMTVAQHAASVARWAEMFNRVEQQRDAALARVEQQERTIAGMNEAHATLAGLYEAAQAQHSVPEVFREKFEQCMKLAFAEIAQYVSPENARDPQSRARRATALATELRAMLAAAPVCRLSRSALTEAQMRRLYENSTETENERLGFEAFARLIRRAEAVHQIAAAPGKEGV